MIVYKTDIGMALSCGCDHNDTQASNFACHDISSGKGCNACLFYSNNNPVIRYFRENHDRSSCDLDVYIGGTSIYLEEETE